MLPEQDAVVAITSETTDMQVVLDLVWEHLLPALDEGTAADAEVAARADAALAKRLTHLALPSPAGTETPRAVPEGVDPDGLVCTADGEGPVSRVQLEQCPDNSGDWILTVSENPRVVEEFGAGYEDFPCGTIMLRLAPGGGWRLSGPGELPTAVSGGWLDAHLLRFDIVFLETPHRLHVTCDLAHRTVEARYRTAPLVVGPLTRLRAPRIR